MKTRFQKKRTAAGWTAIFLSACALTAAGQKPETLPSRPKNPNAGRIRTLTPVLTITDEAGPFYFKSPSKPKFGPDGSIYVLDENQLLRFDALGRFVRNYFRPGQGPGELQSVSGYAATGTHLIVHNASPGKIVRLDLEGKLVSDKAVSSPGGFLVLVHADDETAVFLKRIPPNIAEMKGMDGILDSFHRILSIPVEGGPEKDLGAFPARWYFQKGKEGGAAFGPMDKILMTPRGGKALAVSGTEEYAVKILDLETGTVIRTFSRAYPRMKTPPEDRNGISGGAMIDGKVVKIPPAKYAADIANLLSSGMELWVETSTIAEGKGTLIDVFDPDGAWTDSFYLPLPDPPRRHLLQPYHMDVRGDDLIAVEKTQEETYVLRKYRIGN